MWMIHIVIPASNALSRAAELNHVAQWTQVNNLQLNRPKSTAVAARGCLPPGANVCVAAPANQTSSAIRVFFRISDMGCEAITLGGLLRFPPFSLFPLSPLSPSRLPIPHPFASLKNRSFKFSYKVRGSAISSPNGVWGRVPAEIEFGAF